MTIAPRLRKPLVASIAAGLLIGAALNGLLPRHLPTSYSVAPAFSGCRPDSETNSCNCDGHLPPTGLHQDLAVRSRELLANYSASLCRLAVAVDEFRKAPVENREQLRLAARALLFTPIRGVNDTARELEMVASPIDARLAVAIRR